MAHARVRARAVPAVRALPAVRAMLAVLAVVVLAAVGTLVAVSATGAAVVQSRRVEPFMAGSELRNGAKGCTSGLVLKDNSALGGITEYRRSVRFILTAGHCGEVGDDFRTSAGYSVGTVVWKSSVHDFLLIRVEPRLDRGIAPGCRPGSSNLPCVAISSHYYPRAVGRVLIGSAGIADGAPVRGTTMSGGAIFISGAIGGTVGGFTSIPQPPGLDPEPPHARDRSFASGPAAAVEDGDSGGPLLSHNGNVFGILRGKVGRRANGRTEYHSVSYTKVSAFFAEQSGYALAPPEV